MGGYRSGRKGKRSTRLTTDQADALRPGDLQRSGEDQLPAVERVPCRFGGFREWLRCPRCNRRCREVYRCGNGMGCRRCSGVVYASQYETRLDRAVRQVRKLGPRLGLDPRAVQLAPFLGKPPRMHQRTWENLMERLTKAEGQAVAMLDAKQGRFERWAAESPDRKGALELAYGLVEFS